MYMTHSVFVQARFERNRYILYCLFSYCSHKHVRRGHNDPLCRHVDKERESDIISEYITLCFRFHCISIHYIRFFSFFFTNRGINIERILDRRTNNEVFMTWFLNYSYRHLSVDRFDQSHKPLWHEQRTHSEIIFMIMFE